MPKCCEAVWYPDRADIQQDSSADGEPTEKFTGDAFKKNVPGKVVDTGGDETFQGRKIDPTVSHVFECRYFPGVKPTMRLAIVAGIYKDRLFNIKFAHIIRKQGSVPRYWLYCEELADT